MKFYRNSSVSKSRSTQIFLLRKSTVGLSLAFLLVLSIGLARWSAFPDFASGALHAYQEPLPSMQGKDALDYLKGQGSFDSLSSALAAAMRAEQAGGEPFSSLPRRADLTASDGLPEDNFGWAMAISGNTAVVGAYLDDVVGNADQGSVYVFIRTGSTWTQQAKLNANDGEAGDQFGISVAISSGASSGASGETIVVGAAADTVDGKTNQGSAYVFVRSGISWSQQAKLTANDGLAADSFGNSVAITSDDSGDTVIVGAFADNVAANLAQGSAYIFVRSESTWMQQAHLFASNGAALDFFGISVAISGETAVVGAWSDNVGVNSNQGSAYVFVRSGTDWFQQTNLTANDGESDDQFGGSVAISTGSSGDTVVIGAPFDSNGDSFAQGSAYVFVRSGTVWQQQAKLQAGDGAAEDSFGSAVAITGGTVIIGAPFDDVDSHDNQGSAYIFTRAGTVWSQQTKLTASDGAANDQFGFSVTVGGNTFIAGAPLNDISENPDQGSAHVFAAGTQEQVKLLANDGAASDAFGLSVAISGNTAIIGAYADDVGANSNQGSAYIFVRSGTTWSLQQKITASDGAAEDLFGNPVNIDGDTVIVGAFNDDIGANANQGSAYIFVRNGTTWTEQQKLFASDGATGDGFGGYAIVKGDTAIVSATQDDIDLNSNQGSAYVFTRTGTVWTQQQKLTANDSAAEDFFGGGLALSGDTAIIGAFGNDVDGKTNQGAAYVFTRSGTTWTQQQKLTASDGAMFDTFGPNISLSGDTVIIGAIDAKIGENLGQGAAYVFTNNGSTWTEQQKLTASDGASGDFFGSGIAIEGNTAVIGATRDDVGEIQNLGSLYVFAREGGTWTEQQKITATDGKPEHLLGINVGLSGNSILAGAPEDNIGVNLKQGSAYVFLLCPVITLNPATLPNGTVGETFNQTLNASGGGEPYTFTVTAGTLPNGLALNSTSGLISGVPASSGTSNFTIMATDANGCAGSRAYAIVVNNACSGITVIPVNANLPTGTAGQPYSQTFGAGGGVTPYTFSISEGVLPAGLSLASGGALTGAPTITGTFNFTVQATDASSCTGSRAYTLLINAACPAITINPNTLPAGMIGMAYDQTLTGSGGLAPYNFTVVAGALPNGVSLSAAGVLSGTPALFGSFSFTIKAADANGCMGTQAYTLVINGNTVGNLMFYPLPSPVRLLDTRAGQVGCDAPQAPIAGGTSRTQSAAGRTCSGISIPATAKALTGNITTVESGGGYLTLYPSDSVQPLVANSNYEPNEVLNNVFTVGLGSADGAFNIFVTSTTHVVIDVTGYYAPPGAGGLYFHPLPKPIRLLETRAGFTGCNTPGTRLPGNEDTTQQARLTCDGVTIPASALAITGNATTVNPSGPGFPYLTLFPGDAARPLAASSNYLPGQVMNAPFTVGLSSTGQFKIYPTTQTDLVIDVLGYYSTEASDANGAGLLFNPLPRPVRLLETRVGFGGCSAPGSPIIGGTERTQPTRGVCDGATIANTALAVVGNATVVNSNGGFLTFWPSDAARPLVATSNFAPGQVFNRHFTVGLGADGAFKIFPQFTTDLVVDVSGYFAP